MSSHPPHQLGDLGERHARAYLERRGWRILAPNYRFGRREVDLVAQRDDLIAFVEVKTRAGSDFGVPEEAVTWRKRREIEAVAAEYLARHRLQDLAVRFDVIAVEAGPDRRVARIRHLEDAWRPEPPR